jgi:hypothetical protein
VDFAGIPKRPVGLLDAALNFVRLSTESPRPDYRSGDSPQERQQHHGRRDDYYDSSQNFSDNNASGGYREQGGYGQQQGGYGDQRHHGSDNYGGQGQAGGYDEDVSGAMSHAKQHAGDSADEGIFSNVLGFLGQNKQHLANQDVDEHSKLQTAPYNEIPLLIKLGAVQAHQQFFGGGGNSNQQADSGSMGSAAAMQALKVR